MTLSCRYCIIRNATLEPPSCNHRSVAKDFSIIVTQTYTCKCSSSSYFSIIHFVFTPLKNEYCLDILVEPTVFRVYLYPLRRGESLRPTLCACYQCPILFHEFRGRIFLRRGDCNIPFFRILRITFLNRDQVESEPGIVKFGSERIVTI